MKLWYYSDGEQKIGPIEPQELIQLLKSGKLKPDTYVWSDGMEEWVMARTVEALNGAAFGTPPPLPKIKPAPKNPSAVTPKPAKKVWPKFVTAFFNDDVPLYAGLKRVSVLVGVPLGILFWAGFEETLDVDAPLSAMMGLALGLVAGRAIFWIVKEFQGKTGFPASKLRKASRASWIICAIFGAIVAGIIYEDGYYMDFWEAVFLFFLWWFGSLALFKSVLWTCKGFLRSDA